MLKKKSIIYIVMIFLFILIIYNFYTTFALNEYVFQSEVYTIQNGFINNISPNTDISLFINYFDIENCNVEVHDKNNNQILSGYIPNESITIVKKNNNIIASYTNIVKGDFTKDGKITQEDLNEFGKYLVEKQSITIALQKSLDIDNQNDIHLNDLLLLDKALQNGTQTLNLSQDNILLQSNEKKRIVANITPSYGINRNANWTSSNNSVATVNNAGMITGLSEGTATINVTTSDGKFTKSISVTVDNTIQLSSYDGTAYLEGKKLEVGIKSIDYQNLTCTTSDESIAKCHIDNKKLYIEAVTDGTTQVTVSSPQYGSKIFNVTCISPYINLQYSDYDCLPINSTPNHVTYISTMNAGDLSFSISNENIIEYAYQDGRYFRYKAGTQSGRAQITIKGSNSNRSKIFTADVYQLKFKKIGDLGYLNEEFIAELITSGTGNLTCSTSNEEIATCRIIDDKVYIDSKKTGQVDIEVKNIIEYNGQQNECGTAKFLALIRER